MSLLALREPISALSHGAGLLLSLPGFPLFWRLGRGDLAKRTSLLAYNLSMASCFAASTLFHAVQGPGPVIARFDLLDHLGIYLYIAGSYTCVIWNLLDGGLRRRALAFTWSGTALGLAVQLAYGQLPPLMQTGLYVAIGWGGALILFELCRTLPGGSLRLLVRGGLSYSVGSVFFVLGRPNPWPGVFGSHELFHLFVLAGSLDHFRFILGTVVPARRETMALRPLPSTRGSRDSPLGAGPATMASLFGEVGTTWGRDDGESRAGAVGVRRPDPPRPRGRRPGRRRARAVV